MRTLARLRDDALPLFVTLTLPDEAPTDGVSTRTYLKRFREKVRRRFPASAFIWRREVKARKSGIRVGASVAHFHLLWWGVDEKIDTVRDWVSLAWYQAVGSGEEKHLRAGTKVEVARAARDVRAYMMKQYTAKPDDGLVVEGGGRWWGAHNEDALPWAEAVVQPVTAVGLFRLLRFMRGHVRASMRLRGKRKRRCVGWTWCFTGASQQWANVIASGQFWDDG